MKENLPALIAECAAELLEILPTAMPATCDAQEARKYMAGRTSVKRRITKYRKVATMHVKAHKQLCDAVDWLTRAALAHGVLSSRAHADMVKAIDSCQQKIDGGKKSGLLGGAK